MDQELNQEMEIDLISLIKLLLRKWWLIGLATALGLIVTGGYAYLVLDDTYTAESSMIVQVTSTGDSDYTNLLTGQRLVDTYTEIAKSNRVLNTLKANLDIDMSNGSLRNIISVNSVNDTLIIELRVESEDPVLAKDIANEVVLIVQQLSTEFEGLENVEILDTAVSPANPSGPNRFLYLAVGILLGAMVGSGFVLGVEFLDKNIKKGKDIERILGLRLLGTIPDYTIDEGVE
ncbi:Wzz/FepE/Etk N-terminal domain-containing protein [Candidatus Izimaplasma bacterium]|nr:Wzz/FepE/Etk N-terminal domain-containing protein [Candidatus Izimaplasma bacterium]